MKLHILLTLAASLPFALADAPVYTDIDTYLQIEAGSSYYEEYVNRSMNFGNIGNAIFLKAHTDMTSYYRAKNVNMTVTNGSAIVGENPSRSSIHLTADQGTWNQITLINGSYAFRILGYADSERVASHIADTRIYCKGIAQWSGTAISLIRAEFFLDNVEIYLSDVADDAAENDDIHRGIQAEHNAHLTNKWEDGLIKRPVKIVSDAVGMSSALESVNSFIDLYGADIQIYRTGIAFTESNYGDPGVAKRTDGTPFGLLSVYSDGVISLTDSKISSSNGNILVCGSVYSATLIGETAGVINLNGVNLDDAKDQHIISYLGTLYINLSEGTNFDGYSTVFSVSSPEFDFTGAGSINVAITSGASWNVTRDSDMGLSGSLSLDGKSMISFVSDGGDFTCINTASVMLAEGSVLLLDREAGTFSAGDIVTLFTGAKGEFFVNEGMLLMSSDGWSLGYEDLNNGSFRLTGEIVALIPEPGTAALGLLGLACLALRRREV